MKMVNGSSVWIDIEKEFSAGQAQLSSRKDIYSAMIIYGLLSYSDGELRIPNKELMIEFENALEDDEFGYVAELVRNSSAVLEATINKKGDIVASYLHDILISLLMRVQIKSDKSKIIQLSQSPETGSQRTEQVSI